MPITNKPRGTNDILPGDVERWQEVEAIVRRVCQTYGYRELRTPMFENTELFERGIGETTDIVEKEMYTFQDRGGRSVTLRPEGTAPIVRAYLENKLYSGALPAKLYYIGPMFRYERPQAGRYRQFTQFGLEALGSDDPMLDVETIVLPIEIYRACGLEGFQVELNSIGCPTCRLKYRDALKEHLRPRIEKLCSSCQKRFERNPLRLLDCKVEDCQKQFADIPELPDYLCDECRTHFAQVVTFLEKLSISYTLNPRLVRGFDYYTRTVFEVKYSALGAQDAIGAGGRYDGLIEECGGPPQPGVGFAVGLERLLLALKQEGKLENVGRPLDVFIAHFGGKTKVQAATIAYKLRKLGMWVELDYLDRSLKAQMKAANKLDAKFVLLIGEEELANGQVKLKAMQTGYEELVEIEGVEDILDRRRGEK